MKEIMEQPMFSEPLMVIDKSLNKYNNLPFKSSKLEQARKDIKKPGFPLSIEEENSFWISGTLEQADAHKSTFLITVQSDTKAVKTNFIITTLSETLNDLVKKHWGNMLTVYIKPINGDSKRPKYELLEVKAHQ
jgi:hypothetical protein